MTRDRHDKDQREQGEDFASRWSRLKRRERTAPAEPVAPPVAPVETGAAPAPMQALDERPDEEILMELGLPDPETLKPGDDYAGFMAAAVPARIRNRALRRLWGSNPVLANLDGLVDYADDFTDAATVPEVFRTAYKVGRGWLEDESEANENQAAKTGEAEVAQAVPDDAPEGSFSSGTSASPDNGRSDPESREESAGGGGGAGGREDSAGDGGRLAEAASPDPQGAPRAGPRSRMRFRFVDE